MPNKSKLNDHSFLSNVVGPIAGGWLVEKFDYQKSTFLNIIMMCLLLVLLMYYVMKNKKL